VTNDGLFWLKNICGRRTARTSREISLTISISRAIKTNVNFNWQFLPSANYADRFPRDPFSVDALFGDSPYKELIKLDSMSSPCQIHGCI
jgi:hypothetical protein